MELISTKPSCTVKAAMYEHIGCYEDGEVMNPKTGYPLDVKPLKEIIYSQLDIPKDTLKNHSGGVFPFAYDKMYSINDENIDFHSSGVVFLDIDHLNNDYTRMHYGMQTLCNALPDLLCMHLSSSGNGIHMYFLSPELDKNEYAKYVIFDYIRLSDALKKILRIKLDPSTFDVHQTSMKQRFFLNYPKDGAIYYNDDAVVPRFDFSRIDRTIEENISCFPTLVRKWNSLNPKPQQDNDIDECNEDFSSKTLSCKSGIVEHLGHVDRMCLFNSLRVVFNDNKNVVMSEWRKCMSRMDFSIKHSTQLDYALNEPYKNHWFDYKTPHISYYLLSKFYHIDNLKDTKCEDKEFEILKDKEPKLTQEERTTLEKYL